MRPWDSANLRSARCWTRKGVTPSHAARPTAAIKPKIQPIPVGGPIEWKMKTAAPKSIRSATRKGHIFNFGVEISGINRDRSCKRMRFDAMKKKMRCSSRVPIVPLAPPLQFKRVARWEAICFFGYFLKIEHLTKKERAR